MNEKRNENGGLWGAFLNNIKRVCEKKLDLEKYLFPKENKDRILNLLDEVLTQLRTDEVEDLLKKEKAKLREEKNGDKIVSWLEKEIDIFNNSVDDDFSGPLEDPKHVDIRIGQGKTIKDSIDKLFKLPGWLKKILDVLNELLSLIKGSP